MPTAALWAAASQVSQGIPPWVVAPPSLPSGSAGGGLSAAFPDAEMSVRILAYLGADPTAADSSTWPAAVDLSSRLLDREMVITTGRRQGQRTAASGSCTFVLDNNDGALTPLLATSTYYPGWDLGVPISVDISNLPPNPAAWYPRFRGYAVDIAPAMIPLYGGTLTSVVKVTLGGVIRQQTQGAVPYSLMHEIITGFANISAFSRYWPMEDGGGQFGSAISGYPAIPAPVGVSYAADSTLLCSDALPTLTSSSAMTIPFGDLSSLNGSWTWNFFAKFTSAPAATLTIATIPVLGSTLATIVITADATNVTISAYNSAGTLISSGSSATVWSTLFSGSTWSLINIGADTTNTEAFISARTVGASSGSSATVVDSSISGGYPASFAQIQPSSVMNGAAIGHMYVRADQGFPWAVSDELGAPGQLAHLRFNTVCNHANLPHALNVQTTSRACGLRPVATRMDVIRECESIEHGFLSETLDAWGLTFRASDARTNLDAALTIDLSTYRTATDVEQTLVPMRNDQRIRNQWTITRTGGADSTVRDSTNVAKRGLYNDSEQVNNYTDDDARDEAGWRVAEGIVDRLRYPNLPVDLSANTSLIPYWLALRLGDRIDRTNHPSPHPSDVMAFTVEGYTERLNHTTWSADVVIEPYDVWQVGTLADTSGDLGADLGRLAGDDLAAIRADITSGATSIAFDPLTYRWTTDSDDFAPVMRVRLANTAGVSGGGELIDVSSIATTAATFVAAGALSSADNDIVTPALYAGATADDWIVVVARIRSASAGTIGISSPDYTRVRVLGMSTSSPTQIWAKKHSGTESAPTILPAGGAAGDTVSAYTFGLRSMPIALTDLNDAVVETSSLSNSSAQDIAYPGLAVVKSSAPIDGCVVVLIGGKDDDWTSVATVSGMTEMLDSSTTTGNDQGLVVDYVIQTTSTPVPHGSFTVTGGANAVSEGIAIAFAGGYQTMTVSARSTNGVVKAHSARTKVQVEDALVPAL